MIPEERRQMLFGFLSKNEYTSLHTIFQSFPQISPSTIRRDLQVLTSEGRVILLRGGAKIADSENRYDLPIDSKLQINTLAKKQMSFYAAALVRDGDVVYLDSSSSVYPILQYISAKNVTIVTAGIYTAMRAMKLGFKCIITGGTINNDNGSIVGNITDNQVNNIHFNIAFMSANGFSAQYGITSTYQEEVSKMNIIRSNSDSTYMLMDNTKLGQNFMYRIFGLEDVHIISDAPCDLADRCLSFTVADKIIASEDDTTIYDEEEYL